MSKYSDNSDYDFALRFAPGAGIGVMHDLYVTNTSQYNSLQKLNSEKSRLDIPFLQFGECLHGVGSFKQSMFPQSIGMAASFDTDLVHRVGRAIGAEARSIGIHACFSPVLDLGLEPRWGRGLFCDFLILWDEVLKDEQFRRRGGKICCLRVIWVLLWRLVCRRMDLWQIQMLSLLLSSVRFQFP